MAAHTALGLVGLELFATGPARPRPVPRDVLTTDRLRLLGIVLTVVLVADGGFELFSLDVNGALLSAGGAAVAALMTVRLSRIAARHASLMGTLAHEATHDPLTGLPNRKEFLARLTAELRRPHGCLVLFCDLDGFKAANDRYGHAAGDLLLVEVALRLRQGLRSNDTVARFGGDEFVILYREAAGHDQAVLCARLRAAVAQPIQLGADSVVLGVSIGGAYSDGAVEGADAVADELIRTADEAMYANKQCRARAAGAAPRTGRPFERPVHRYLVTDGDGGSPPERARPSRVSAAAHPTDAGWSLAS
jgi:diguanylate cyclase